MASGFINRLGYYLIGLSIGIVILTFVIKKKTGSGLDFCYLPNCRVLKDLRKKPLVYDQNMPNLFEKDSVLWNSFFTHGNVDFKRSDTESTPCKKYVIINEKKRELVVLSCEHQVKVELIH